jgi:hypothetical protein
MKVLAIIALATAIWASISWIAAVAYLVGIGTVMLCAELVDDDDPIQTI